jgi:hypothetical protein
MMLNRNDAIALIQRAWLERIQTRPVVTGPVRFLCPPLDHIGGTRHCVQDVERGAAEADVPAEGWVT